MLVPIANSPTRSEFSSVWCKPRILLELLVRAAAGDDAVFRDLYRKRRGLKQAITRAQPVTNDTIHDERAVDFTGRGEAFAAGKIAPFFLRDDAGGLEPPVVGVHVGDNAGACWSGGADTGGAAHAIQNLLREAVNLVVVGAHAVAHDLRRDVDHVGVTHAAAVHDIGHLHARAQFIGLHLHGENRNLGRFHILKHRGGHVCERARREVFKNEGIERASALGELGGNRSCDGLRHAIGDQRDLFVRLNAQTGEDGGAGAGNKLCWIGLRK